MIFGKKLFIGTGIAVAALFAFGAKKVKAGKEVLSNLKFTVKSISHIRLDWPEIIFNLDLNVTNNTNIDFGATLGSSISIKKIEVFNEEGVLLGSASTNIYSIDLPAYETISLPTIIMYADALKALDEFGTNLQLYLENNFSKLRYKIHIEAFGTNVAIDA